MPSFVPTASSKPTTFYRSYRDIFGFTPASTYTVSGDPLAPVVTQQIHLIRPDAYYNDIPTYGPVNYGTWGTFCASGEVYVTASSSSTLGSRMAGAISEGTYLRSVTAPDEGWVGGINIAAAGVSPRPFLRNNINHNAVFLPFASATTIGYVVWAYWENGSGKAWHLVQTPVKAAAGSTWGAVQWGKTTHLTTNCPVEAKSQAGGDRFSVSSIHEVAPGVFICQVSRLAKTAAEASGTDPHHSLEWWKVNTNPGAASAVWTKLPVNWQAPYSGDEASNNWNETTANVNQNYWWRTYSFAAPYDGPGELAAGRSGSGMTVVVFNGAPTPLVNGSPTGKTFYFVERNGVCSEIRELVPTYNASTPDFVAGLGSTYFLPASLVQVGTFRDNQWGGLWLSGTFVRVADDGIAQRINCYLVGNSAKIGTEANTFYTGNFAWSFGARNFFIDDGAYPIVFPLPANNRTSLEFETDGAFPGQNAAPAAVSYTMGNGSPYTLSSDKVYSGTTAVLWVHNSLGSSFSCDMSNTQFRRPPWLPATGVFAASIGYAAQQGGSIQMQIDPSIKNKFPTGNTVEFLYSPVDYVLTNYGYTADVGTSTTHLGTFVLEDSGAGNQSGLALPVDINGMDIGSGLIANWNSPIDIFTEPKSSFPDSGNRKLLPTVALTNVIPKTLSDDNHLSWDATQGLKQKGINRPGIYYNTQSLVGKDTLQKGRVTFYGEVDLNVGLQAFGSLFAADTEGRIAGAFLTPSSARAKLRDPNRNSPSQAVASSSSAKVDILGSRWTSATVYANPATAEETAYNATRAAFTLQAGERQLVGINGKWANGAAIAANQEDSTVFHAGNAATAVSSRAVVAGGGSYVYEATPSIWQDVPYDFAVKRMGDRVLVWYKQAQYENGDSIGSSGDQTLQYPNEWTLLTHYKAHPIYDFWETNKAKQYRGFAAGTDSWSMKNTMWPDSQVGFSSTRFNKFYKDGSPVQDNAGDSRATYRLTNEIYSGDGSVARDSNIGAFPMPVIGQGALMKLDGALYTARYWESNGITHKSLDAGVDGMNPGGTESGWILAFQGNVVARKDIPSITLTDTGWGNVAPGTHAYAVTYVRPTEEVFATETVSINIAGNNGRQVTISNIPVDPTGAATGKKLYRTAANASTLKLVTTLGANDVSYVDSTVADGALGATVVADYGIAQALGIPCRSADYEAHNADSRKNLGPMGYFIVNNEIMRWRGEMITLGDEISSSGGLTQSGGSVRSRKGAAYLLSIPQSICPIDGGGRETTTWQRLMYKASDDLNFSSNKYAWKRSWYSLRDGRNYVDGAALRQLVYWPGWIINNDGVTARASYAYFYPMAWQCRRVYYPFDIWYGWTSSRLGNPGAGKGAFLEWHDQSTVSSDTPSSFYLKAAWRAREPISPSQNEYGIRTSTPYISSGYLYPGLKTFSLAAGGGGNIPEGTYYYAITYVRPAGEVIATGALPVAVSAGGSVSLSNIPNDPLGLATSKKIYRNYTLVGTVGPAATTYVDTAASGTTSMGALVKYALDDYDFPKPRPKENKEFLWGGIYADNNSYGDETTIHDSEGNKHALGYLNDYGTINANDNTSIEGNDWRHAFEWLETSDKYLINDLVVAKSWQDLTDQSYVLASARAQLQSDKGEHVIGDYITSYPVANANGAFMPANGPITKSIGVHKNQCFSGPYRSVADSLHSVLGLAGVKARFRGQQFTLSESASTNVMSDPNTAQGLFSTNGISFWLKSPDFTAADIYFRNNNYWLSIAAGDIGYFGYPETKTFSTTLWVGDSQYRALRLTLGWGAQDRPTAGYGIGLNAGPGPTGSILERITVPIFVPASSALDAPIRVSLAGDILSVDYGDCALWTFDLGSYHSVDATKNYYSSAEGPVNIALAIGTQPVIAYVPELGDDVESVVVDRGGAISGGLSMLLTGRWINLVPGRDGTITPGRYLIRDPGTLFDRSKYVFSEQVGDTPMIPAGHIESAGASFGEILDSAWIRANGYSFRENNNRLVLSAADARRDARLQVRAEKESSSPLTMSGQLLPSIEPEQSLMVLSQSGPDYVVESHRMSISLAESKSDIVCRKYYGI